jgi:hypothetical protein
LNLKHIFCKGIELIRSFNKQIITLLIIMIKNASFNTLIFETWSLNLAAHNSTPHNLNISPHNFGQILST